MTLGKKKWYLARKNRKRYELWKKIRMMRRYFCSLRSVGQILLTALICMKRNRLTAPIRKKTVRYWTATLFLIS